jgi:hypothetical protein
MQPAEKNSKGKSSVFNVFLTPEKPFFSYTEIIKGILDNKF